MRSTSCSSGSSPPLRRGALRFLPLILRNEGSDDAALILGSAAEAGDGDDDDDDYDDMLSSQSLILGSAAEAGDGDDDDDMLSSQPKS